LASSDCSDASALFAFPQPLENARLIVDLSLIHDVVMTVNFRDGGGSQRWGDIRLLGNYYDGLPATKLILPDTPLAASNVQEIEMKLERGSAPPVDDIRACTATVVADGFLTDPTALQCLSNGSINVTFAHPQDNYRLQLDLALHHDDVLEWSLYGASGETLASDFILIGDYYEGLPRQTLTFPDLSRPALSGVTGAHVALTARPTDNVRWCSLLSASAPPEPVDMQRFLQFNMCGSEGSAKVEKRNPKCSMDRVAEAVARSIRDFQPTIVTLNEACESQVEDVIGFLNEPRPWDSKDPWPMTKEFGVTNPEKNRCSNRQFGNAVLVRGPLTKDPNSPYLLPNRRGEQEERNMVCVITSSQAVPIRACSTHIVNKDKKPNREWNRAQVFEVARLANSWVSDGQAVVIGGDFNNAPEDLSDENTSGVLTAFLQRFSDVDELNRPTHPDGKIDYIFLSTNHFSNITGFPTTSDFSDHYPLRGTATLSP
jgi:endonuclease/exonuclease/phosphatase family metal-dependent hydrolase